MKLLLIVVAVGLLWCISFLHIYWAFGGRWGSAAVIPVKEGEHKPAFTPRIWGTLFVAILILLASVIIVVQVGYLQGFEANSLSKIGSIVCALVFIVRAIGDFKFVGFFKKNKHSQFARYDTWFYSPLCLFFGFVYIMLLF
ncbi:DUF3995 domain-containing protein [Bacillus mycoides]|uniref:DUF3995 domain-containing protein n=1 Tax=Bacillus mycoides TaxID=1405 RepID=UPI003D095429